ncbi:MAG: M17 family peptidase N-terminal domain-containing protein, partial [Candidatus Thermoplasmatota archaeon]|nr:M17 family peptidase N-terminal domain-containing protein [Candidatus Thermoplasmatota archaeon]
MKIQVEEISTLNGTLILPCFEGCEKPPSKTMNEADRVTRSLIKKILASDDFSGKSEENMSVFGGGNKVILVGLGKKDNITTKIARDTGAKTLAKLSKTHGKDFTIRFSSEWKLNMMAAFVEGMILRDYKYDKYISKKDDDNDDSPFNLHIQCSPRHVDNLKNMCEESYNVATGVHLARDLGNSPPNDLYPMAYANIAKDWAKGKKNVSVTVIDWEGILENKMGGLENVGKGSSRKPCMVIFEMNKPSGKGNPPVIVGKGITFDTGGISLKPGASMDEMKYDMHGSATVFGLMQALHAC